MATVNQLEVKVTWEPGAFEEITAHFLRSLPDEELLNALDHASIRLLRAGTGTAIDLHEYNEAFDEWKLIKREDLKRIPRRQAEARKLKKGNR